MEDYTLIVNKSATRLQTAVNDKLAEGYVLIGGLSISIEKDDSFVFGQAMVKPKQTT